MNSVPGRKKAVSIALVVDERLTRDRRGTLSRVVSALRQFAHVEIIHGEITQDELIEKLKRDSFGLVLAPWYRYLEWTKVDAHFGLTRSQGPTFAGYFCDPIDPSEIGAPGSTLRTILFDFSDTYPHEAAVLIQSLLVDTRRTGIRPLLDPGTSVYCENWYPAQGQGTRCDTLLSLPELAQTGWSDRAASIRLISGALWSLVYEEGPGKSELNLAINGGKTPRGYFQVGCDAKTFALRLCYASPGSSAKSALAAYWPDGARPTGASQILLKYADFLRVHTISDGQEVEVTVGLFKSAPAHKAHRRLHSLWIEPVSPNLVSELAFEAPGPDQKHLKALPTSAVADTKTRTAGSEEEKNRERLLFESAAKLRDLKKLLSERDELIKELKCGGVGTAAPTAHPDAEGLIESFQQKYFEARFQIRQFEVQIHGLEQRGAPPSEIEKLRLKMAALASREEAWIRKLATTIQDYRDARKAAAGSGNGG